MAQPSSVAGVDNTFRKKFDHEEYLQLARDREEMAGYSCSVCECVVKDSANYLDHINGKKHQRSLGMSMRVERASLEQDVYLEMRNEDLASHQKEKTVEEEPEEDQDVAALMGFGGFRTHSHMILLGS